MSKRATCTIKLNLSTEEKETIKKRQIEKEASEFYDANYADSDVPKGMFLVECRVAEKPPKKHGMTKEEHDFVFYDEVMKFCIEMKRKQRLWEQEERDEEERRRKQKEQEERDDELYYKIQTKMERTWETHWKPFGVSWTEWMFVDSPYKENNDARGYLINEQKKRAEREEEARKSVEEDDTPIPVQPRRKINEEDCKNNHTVLEVVDCDIVKFCAHFVRINKCKTQKSAKEILKPILTDLLVFYGDDLEEYGECYDEIDKADTKLDNKEFVKQILEIANSKTEEIVKPAGKDFFEALMSGEIEELEVLEEGNEEHFTLNNDIYAIYKSYCEKHKITPVYINRFSPKLKELGFTSKTTKKGVVFYGILLKTE